MKYTHTDEQQLILLQGKLRERARWGEFCVLIGYKTGNPERAISAHLAPARDCPFCSRNKISSKSKRAHGSFLLQNICRGSQKIFCDFSVGMELENEKTKSVNENENKENKTHFYIVKTTSTQA